MMVSAPQTSLFETEALSQTVKAPNVSTVPQRSPFRYPGGKTWLIPFFRRWIKSLPHPPEVLVEPFAGGGVVSLSAIFEGLASRAIMVERDENVASVWLEILSGGARKLCDKIVSLPLNSEYVTHVLASSPNDNLERAFQTIVRNRMCHGGIMAPGAGLIKTGENGRGLFSRWYPATLAHRISAIDSIKHKISFLHGDAFSTFDEYSHREDAAWFIDPPYTAGGKRAGSRLYQYHVIDHESLFERVALLKSPALLTYDISEYVEKLSKAHGFELSTIPMKNTHNNVLFEYAIEHRPKKV